MASFLLLARSTGRTGRVEGDPVGIFPNNHVFGQREDKSVWLAQGNDAADWPGTFLVVRMPGISVAKAKRMMQPHRRKANLLEEEFTAPDEADRYIPLGRHRWRFRLSELTPSRRQALRRSGTITIQYDRAVANGIFFDRAGLDDFDPVGDPVDP